MPFKSEYSPAPWIVLGPVVIVGHFDWWVPVVLAVLVGFSVVRQRRRLKAFQGPAFVLDAHASGLRYWSRGTSGDLPWTAIEKAIDRRDVVVLKLASRGIMALPLVSAERPGDVEALRSLLAQSLGPEFRRAV